MAGFMTVKRLRTILADRSLDNHLVFLGPTDRLVIGPNRAELILGVDFQDEQIVHIEASIAQAADGETVFLEHIPREPDSEE